MSHPNQTFFAKCNLRNIYFIIWILGPQVLMTPCSFFFWNFFFAIIDNFYDFISSNVKVQCRVFDFILALQLCHLDTLEKRREISDMLFLFSIVIVCSVACSSVYLLILSVKRLFSILSKYVITRYSMLSTISEFT